MDYTTGGQGNSRAEDEGIKRNEIAAIVARCSRCPVAGHWAVLNEATVQAISS